jgi:O-antigen ligase
MGYSKQFVFLYKNSPYFGDIARMKGFSASSNTLSSILIFSFLITNAWIKGSKQLIFNLFICLGLLGTYSKESIYFVGLLLLLASNHLLSSFFSKNQQTWLFRMAYGLLWLGSVATSLWIFQSSTSKFVPAQAGAPIPIGNSLTARPTGYWYLVEASWRSIQQNPWFGIGLGNFETQTALDQKAGLYPNYVLPYDAHDLYWGLVAQFGIGYILFFIFFIWSFKKCVDTLLANEIMPKPLILSIQYIGLFILLDIIGDIGALHFRHYWIVFGLVSGLYALSNKQPTTESNFPAAF